MSFDVFQENADSFFSLSEDLLHHFLNCLLSLISRSISRCLDLTSDGMTFSLLPLNPNHCFLSIVRFIPSRTLFKDSLQFYVYCVPQLLLFGCWPFKTGLMAAALSLLHWFALVGSEVPSCSITVLELPSSGQLYSVNCGETPVAELHSTDLTGFSGNTYQCKAPVFLCLSTL